MDLTTFSPGSALVTIILLALAPFAAVMVTSFTKIVVVLSLLRNALGLQQTPPNIVLNGLALVLTAFVMYPVGLEINDIISASNTDLTSTGGLTGLSVEAREPLREFLLKHSDPQHRAFFLSTITQVLGAKGPVISDTDLIILVPSFTVSELAEAFQIGFLIFLPFLVIDLVVANILLAMGMMMLSPTIISLPFKLLLFVMINGWAQLVHGLVLSYV
ncbi:MAG: type III secretion system export apparatus subunit SctR [Pseudomonadota bacterium]